LFDKRFLAYEDMFLVAIAGVGLYNLTELANRNMVRVKCLLTAPR
jgi:hypothetical protein